MSKKKLSKLQEEALKSIQKNGRIIGIMHGSIGFEFIWQKQNVTDPIPHNLTIRSLLRRGLLYTKSHRSHPVIGEALITHDRNDWLD